MPRTSPPPLEVIMARVFLFLLISLLGLPALAPRLSAQEDPSPKILEAPRSRLVITPLLGARVPLLAERQERVVVPGELLPLPVLFETRGAGGGVAGVEAELRLIGPVGIAAAFAFTNPDELLLKVETPNRALLQVPYRGPSVWFSRVDLVYRLPDPEPDKRSYRPAAYVSVGPARVREMFGDAVLALAGEDVVDSWALHMGAKAILPFGSRHVLFHVGLEDYATFWNPHDAERVRVERALRLQPGTLVDLSLGTNRTHVLMANIGLSFRM